MAKECVITGKSGQTGGGYSNRTRATQFNPTGKRRRKANIQKKKIFVPELKKHLKINKNLHFHRKNGPDPKNTQN